MKALTIYHTQGDLRLQEIRHKVGATNLAAHVYGYKAAGNIKSWSQTKKEKGTHQL